jgi:hypothetical protein
MPVLAVLEGRVAITRLPPTAPVPTWLSAGPIVSATRTATELSVICGEACIPAEVQAERGWRVLAVAGPLDFGLTGILSSIANPLADAKVSLFAVSTYDSDYVLVRDEDLDRAVGALRAAGHRVVNVPVVPGPP